MNRKPLNLIALFLFSSVLFIRNSQAQERAGSGLYTTIYRLDSIFFHAYNTCEVQVLESLLSDSLEFYHDKGGLTRGSAAIIKSLKQNICGKVRREPVPGTLQVFIMEGYGAIESGEHYFYDIINGNNGDKNKPVGRARFFHLWQEKEGRWKMTRIISYDHQPAT